MSDMQELARQLAPEFEVTRELGSGAMGTVYLAREVALRRLVAIKVPLAELADDEQVLARFQREAHAAARIHHRGACTLHRIGTLEDGTPYLVMEYVEGKTLDDVLAAGGTFDVDTAMSILEQVSGALAAAHAVGVVHRDIRPGNVIWDAAAGRAVLTDFGIAGILETGSEAVTRITRMGQTLGQVGFSSPEQLLGETVTAATDVYSLGVLAHHVLTGQGPYEVKSKIEVVQAHVKGEARPLRQVRADVDPRVEDTVLRCLAKTPSQRPEAQAVERIVSEVRAGPVGPASTGSHPVPQVDSALPPVFQQFIREVQRRRVGAVAIGYIVVGWVILSVMATLRDTTSILSERVSTLLVIILLAGFPVTLIFSWLYDITSGGVERTQSDSPRSERRGLIALQIGAVVVSLLIAGTLGWWILTGS
jgi:serine/threonine-protein kinase